MADVHDKKTRSFNMSRIKGKDTKPGMAVFFEPQLVRRGG
jgi:DNA mismatch endonuclease, patch repair protein